MSAATWVAVYLPLFIVLWLLWQTRRGVRQCRAAAIHRKKGGVPIMEAIILKLMQKGVAITTINDTLTGKLTRYENGWLTLTDAKGREQYVNADYIIKMKETAIKF